MDTSINSLIHSIISLIIQLERIQKYNALISKTGVSLKGKRKRKRKRTLNKEKWGKTTLFKLELARGEEKKKEIN